MKFIGASYISSYFFSKGSFDFVNNKSISYNIYSCIIQIVKDHVVFWPVFLPLPVKYRVGERDRKLHHQHHFHSNQRTRNCLAKWTFVRSFTPNVPVVTLVMFSAKMAASFKVPSFAKRSKLGTSFPKFDWRDIEIIEELRSGTFGHVFRATFVKESGNVVIKKLKGESAESRHQFKKEGGGILNKVKGTHTGTLPSSWEFVGTHTQLWWCMDVFYFSHFGVHKKVSSLESFTCHWLRVRFHIIYRATAMCKRRRLWPRIFAQTRHYGIYAGGDMPTLFWWCPYTLLVISLPLAFWWCPYIFWWFLCTWWNSYQVDLYVVCCCYISPDMGELAETFTILYKRTVLSWNMKIEILAKLLIFFWTSWSQLYAFFGQFLILKKFTIKFGTRVK